MTANDSKSGAVSSIKKSDKSTAVEARARMEGRHGGSAEADLSVQRDELKRAQARLHLAARMGEFGTFYADLDCGEVNLSAEVGNLIGAENPVSEVRPLRELSSIAVPEDRERLSDLLLWATIEDEEQPVFSCEFRLKTASGKHRWVLMRGSIVQAPTGETSASRHIAGIIIDISQQKRFESQLVSAQQSAQVASKSKSTFLATMSHEIRTPLTAILGFSELLADRIDDPELLSHVDAIRENGAHLGLIVDDVLDLAKIEAGKFNVELETVSIANVLRAVNRMMRGRATSKSVSFEIRSEGRVPVTVRSSERVLRQILLNLAGNAVKFTAKGSIEIGVSCDEGNERLRVTVTDSGIGIDAGKLGVLFEPFAQVDSSRRRLAEGTGLGLSISRQLARAVGGEISVQSKLGRGSTFTLEVPTGSLADVNWTEEIDLSNAQSSVSGSYAALSQIDAHILAVDDQESIRLILEEFLSSAGASVVTAASGPGALEIWEGQPRNCFDAILIDIQMPGMDGVQLCERLRLAGCRQPVIAVTANALTSDRKDYLDAGFDQVVTKPISRPRLIKIIADLTESAADSGNAGENASHVLLVDDHADTLVATQLLLQGRGYSVDTAINAHEAEAQFAQQQPDVVLMDLGLGETSGEALLKTLRQASGDKRSRFVCVTGRSEPESNWRNAGFDSYMQKPIDIERVVAEIEEQ